MVPTGAKSSSSSSSSHRHLRLLSQPAALLLQSLRRQGREQLLLRGQRMMGQTSSVAWRRPSSSRPNHKQHLTLRQHQQMRGALSPLLLLLLLLEGKPKGLHLLLRRRRQGCRLSSSMRSRA
jgi:hypothetical protein